MNKVFDPGMLELADSRGDPNRVVEIQYKVGEMLGANRQRQAGLSREILEEGAWALPGLLNATYVWMNNLEDKQTQTMLAKLMAQLVQGNEAAEDLLFRAGILETPFAVPRAIARRALEQLDWKPSETDAQQLRQKIDEQAKLGDAATVLELYASLLRSGSEDDLNIALQSCKQWVQRMLADSGRLLALLVRHFPDHAERVLSEVFLEVARARDNAYKDEDIARALLVPLHPIPPNWLVEGVLLRVSTGVLRRLHPPRHKTIEYLWIYAAQDCKEKDPTLWKKLLVSIGEQVAREENKDICRYWLRASYEAHEIEYIIDQAQVISEPYGTVAAAQLFFSR